MPTTSLKLAVLALIFGVLPACAMNSDRPVKGGPNAEEAAIRLESSKREYQNCVENAGPGQPTCDAIEALYKKDRQAYENSLK